MLHDRYGIHLELRYKHGTPAAHLPNVLLGNTCDTLVEHPMEYRWDIYTIIE